MRWSIVLASICCLGCFSACAREDETPREATVSGPRLSDGSFVAELGSFPIHYEVHGSGPAMMTLPNSWGLSLEGLRALFRPLEEHLTLVYFDPRGMGGSGPVVRRNDLGVAAVRADFDSLRRHLGLERVHAIGWSNGAMNLLMLAGERPEILRSAVFVHGVASFTDEDFAALTEARPKLFERFAEVTRELGREGLGSEERNQGLRSFFLEDYFPQLFADPGAGRALLPQLWARTQFSWDHWQYVNEEMPVFDARDRLAAISVPSLVIAGAHDLMPPEKVEEIHRGIAGSRFVVFPDSGHFAPIEEPTAFVRTVLDFLRDRSRPGDGPDPGTG